MANTPGYTPSGSSSGGMGGSGKTDGNKDDLAKRAGQAVDDAKDGARKAADHAASQAKDVASQAKDVVNRVGETLSSAAGDVQGRAQDVYRQARSYVEGQDVGAMGQSVVHLIERNPVPAVLLGVAVGFLLARATSSRS